MPKSVADAGGGACSSCNPNPVTATGFRTADFDYVLPADRIARHPVEPRDAARLMVVERASGEIRHLHFRDLPSLIPAGDALVLNTTKVFRARLLGTRSSGAPAEVLLLRPIDGTTFEAMVHPGGKLKPGRHIQVADGFDVEILEATPRRTRLVRLHTTLPLIEAIERHGHVPIPPYLERADDATDAARYQTVYAHQAGSVAAPTAGLHFTEQVLHALASKGVERVDVVLHIGAGTFKPVQHDDPAEHDMHEEWYEVSSSAAARLNAVHARGGAVWAVGTTCMRTLESAADPDGTVRAEQAETTLFIRPPYTFRAVDHLVTNFHLPRSTLIMLVSAFAGYELTRHAYDVAVNEGYRFYSYGDSMVVI
ncbi:MAG: tRNA preQ1(34) S-adenosylmethionine ribosyltransferase-isomerase QueA [Gemmatimonadaceae bacterium]|nr:tRNA preQ1(34) S-adenosylmethionine ribosyltransferase-isomerase QueA [Gemmatimonadaceae bacterium]